MAISLAPLSLSRSATSDRALPIASAVMYGSIIAGYIFFQFMIHPDWYGDAVWYASDLRDGTIWNDPGHLLWRPAAWLLWRFLLLLFPGIDPIIALQLLSSLGGVLLVIGSYKLATCLSHSRFISFLTGALVGFSSFLILYGASGSSYSTSAAALTWAFYFAATRNRAASPLFALAVLTWAPAILAFPAFLFTPLLLGKAQKQLAENRHTENGLTKSRLLANTTFLSLALILIALTAAFLCSKQSSLTDWILSSSHQIPISISIMGAARAVIGFFSSIVFTDVLGTALKGRLLNDPALSQIPIAAGILFACVTLTVAILAATLSLGADRRFRAMLLFWVLALTPFACFAALWQGSDVERFSPILSITIASLVIGIARRSTSLALAIVVALTLHNIVAIHPALNPRSKLATEIGLAAKANLKPQSLLIVAGQRFNPHLWAPIIYFHNFKVHSISFDVQQNGAASWQENLSDAISEAVSSGGDISIISDFKGKATAQGIWLSSNEIPEPTLGEIQHFFTDFNEVASWSVGDITFITVERLK